MYRFALSYFFLFACIGVYAPWMPPLLEHRGLSEREIGWALAVVSVSRALFPPLWGLVADRLPSTRPLLGVAALAAGAALLGLMLPASPQSALAWLFVFGFFLVPVVPLLETMTLASLGQEERERYGSIRLWGSLGFIVTSLGLGWLVPRIGISSVPVAAGLPLLIVGLLAFTLRHGRQEVGVAPTLRDLPWRTLWPILIAAALGQASHGPYYAFFTLQMKAQGVELWAIGSLWSWGVLVEIALMAASAWLFARVGLLRAMRWALLLACVRWLMLASVESIWLILVAQTLHAATFGLLHLTVVQIFDQAIPKQSRAFGQTVLSAGVYGVGVGGGLALSGQFVDSLHYSGLYLVAAAVSLLGLLVTFATKQ